MKRKILIVDDDPDSLQTFVDLFESEGYEVSRAVTGEEALAAINGYRPDVMLLDIMLPGRNGIEVARTLAARGEAEGRIPIVMVTALTGFCVGETNLAATTGIKRFVFKPCRPRTLVQVVDDAIRYRL